MKAGKIQSFGRIIKINSDSDNKKSNSRVDSSTFEICKILNSEHTSKYSKEQAKSIRDFFKSVLGDYNGENGILIQKNENGDALLISGKDALKVNNWKKNRKKLGEKKLADLINQLTIKKIEPEFSIDFKTGYKTKTGFNIFNEIIYGKTKLTYGKYIDGTILTETSEGKKIVCGIDYEETSLKI